MANENSVSDVFRFVQLRPRRTLAETPSIPLADSTKLVRQLADAPSVGRRAAVANAALKAATIHGPDDTPLGPQIVSARQTLAAQAEATTDDLGHALPELAGLRASEEFQPRRLSLSDVLLASTFASEGIPADLAALEDVFRVYHLPAADQPPVALATFLRRPLLAHRRRRRRLDSDGGARNEPKRRWRCGHRASPGSPKTHVAAVRARAVGTGRHPWRRRR